MQWAQEKEWVREKVASGLRISYTYFLSLALVFKPSALQQRGFAATFARHSDQYVHVFVPAVEIVDRLNPCEERPSPTFLPLNDRHEPEPRVQR